MNAVTAEAAVPSKRVFHSLITAFEFSFNAEAS